MKLPVFPIEELESPDIELGVTLMAWWITYQAEKHGVGQITSEIVKSIILATQELDCDNAGLAALEKALRLAAKGEYSRSGYLFRQFFVNGGIDIFEAKQTSIALNYRKSQSDKAKKSRKAKKGGGTINDIVKGIATSKEHEELSAVELWNHFLSELDGRKLHPKEDFNIEKERESTVEYDFNGGRKSMKLGNFSNIVSQARKSKKKPKKK